MLARILFDWNQIAGLVTAACVNAFPATLLLAAVAWLLVLVQKRLTAASRYWVWWIVLVSVALLPVAQAFLPKPVSTFQTETRLLGIPEKLVSASEIHSFTALAPNPLFRIGNRRPHSTLSIAGLFLLVWAAMIAFQLSRLAFAFRNTMSLKRSAIRPTAELQRKWHERLETCRVKRPVTLGLSTKIASPAASGYSRPLILLPVSVANKLTTDELDQILLHELAHIRRCDDWAITVQRFMEALLVLHPLVRLVTKKIELEREIACDDWVVSTQPAQAYASCLTKLAELRVVARSNRLAIAAVEHKSQLSRRIEMLLDNTRTVTTHVSPRRLGSIAIVLLVLAVMGIRSPCLVAYPAAAKPPAPPQAAAVPPAPAPPKPPEPAVTKPQQPPAPKPPALPKSRVAAKDPSPPLRPVAPEEDILRSIEQTVDHLESTAEQQKLLEDLARRAAENVKATDPKLNREALEKLVAEIQREFKARENATEYGELKHQIEDAQNQLGQVDIEKLTREIERSQKEMSRIDLAELKREIERCKQQLSHIDVDELKREIQRLEDEVHALSKGSGGRVP
jgi:beta-lactamase regulating signal transducer with metallopeptidase domain